MYHFSTLAAVATLAFLAACATPQELCISQAQSRPAAISEQIATTSGNIDRGYAIFRQSVPYTYASTCYDDSGAAYSCQENGTRIEETPVAIDVAQERRKLVRLKANLVQARRQAEAEIAQCRAQFPE